MQSITQKEEKIMNADAACLEDIISSELTATVATALSQETDGDSKPIEGG